MVLYCNFIQFSFFLVVDTQVGRQVQVHRQAVYESLKEYLKGGLRMVLIQLQAADMGQTQVKQSNLR